jgi:hypothetical protein
VLSNGLVAYLPFDGNYSDLQGNVTAKAVGSPTFEAGKRGQGIHVKNLKDGSLNNYVTLGYPNALKFGDSKDFTVSFWVKQISQADDQAFISNKDWNSANNRGWGVFSQGGSELRVQLTGPNGSTDKFSKNPPANLPDSAWHLITVAVARTGNVDTYVDGALALSSPMTAKGNIDTDDLAHVRSQRVDGVRGDHHACAQLSQRVGGRKARHSSSGHEDAEPPPVGVPTCQECEVCGHGDYLESHSR